MHESSYLTMSIIVEKYFKPQLNGEVLDVGGGDYNGSYKELFEGTQLEYYYAEMDDAAQVTDSNKLRVNEEGVIENNGKYFDYVISGQMLEHCEDPVFTFRELIRVLKPNGILALIVPSCGPDHKYPLDCYRFYPDSYRVFAKKSNVSLIDLFLDNLGPWNDLSGVFKNSKPIDNKIKPTSIKCFREGEKASTGREHDKKIQLQFNNNTNSPQTKFDHDGACAPISYIDVLQELHSSLNPQKYIEIGVRHGASLLKSDAAVSIGIDPAPELSRKLRANEQIYATTSDKYFRECDQSNIDDSTKNFDLAFIDGMHLAEYALRDFINLEARSHSKSVIVIDDILPPTYESGFRRRQTNVWVGDVWKTLKTLVDKRDDLKIKIRYCEPSAMAIISNLNSKDKSLSAKYNPIARSYKKESTIPEISSFIKSLEALK